MNDLFFDYHLPPRLIAQRPAEPRDSARLLVLGRHTGTIAHHAFRDLPDLLAPGDLVVLNDTRVIPARVVGQRAGTGGKWEALFIRETADGDWEMLAKTRGHPAEGEAFAVEPGPLRLILVGRTHDRHWLMRPDPPGPAADLLAAHGQIPLPPYIRHGRALPDDVTRYQTVYADHPGSVAAPTAGLHFTPELLGRLADRGVGTAKVTLHVGIGTFEPVKADDPADHVIHSEWCEVGPDTIAAIAAAKRRGNRVVAVGTTTTRTLETARGRPYRGESDLYIRPPFEFSTVDAMVTNFHLPRTTLLLLVQAFARPDNIRAAYTAAIESDYRFYSYGDAMFIR